MNEPINYKLVNSQILANNKPIKLSKAVELLNSNYDEMRRLLELPEKKEEENAVLHKEKMKYKRRLEEHEEIRRLRLQGH